MISGSKILKILLWTGAVGWGVSLLGVLLPWNVVEPMLLNMGMANPLADPQIHYWFRMTTGGWAVIGFLFLMTALFPERYKNLIPLLAVGSLFEGVVLLIHGLMLNRPAFPVYGDTAFCLVVGAGLLVCRYRQQVTRGKNAKPQEWIMPKLDAQLIVFVQKCRDALRKNAKTIGIGLSVFAGAAILTLTVVVICIAPEVRLQGHLPTLKMTFCILDDYRKNNGEVPAEYGEFRKCSFSAAEMLDDPEMAGFFYLGRLGNEQEIVPIVIYPTNPHWFYQKLCRLPQKTWVQYSDGHSELVELPPDTSGFAPLADAILKRHAFSPETAQKIRVRFQELEKMR